MAQMKGTCHCGSAAWTFEGMPESATACNCTLCRRYGVLWAYDYEGEGISISGKTRAYVHGQDIEFHFCETCACVICWRGIKTDEAGRRRIAVNLRLTDPDLVADVPMRHFEGLVSFEDLPMDGRTVRDYWF